MINRDARDKAAEALRHFLSGRITNEQFVNFYPSSSNDAAISAMYSTVWNLFDDFIEHKLTNDYELTPQTKSDVCRWILFLYSSFEYEWPKIDAPGLRLYYQPHWLDKLLFRAHHIRKRTKSFVEYGDYDVWPFRMRQDYIRSLTEPVLLTGRNRDTRSLERA